MNKLSRSNARLRPVGAGLLLLVGLAFSNGCRKMTIDKNELRDFQQINLVSNSAKYSPFLTDTLLQNAWGLAWAPSGIAWVNSQAGHVSALYTADGGVPRAPVKIPSPGDTSKGGAPTGVVFNSSKGFKISDGAAANFLFVGVDGMVTGWNGAAGASAKVVANNSATSSYTGLAMAVNSGASYLYAADFRTGKIDVWDSTFTAVTWMPFRDPAIPSGFAPFNIQSVATWLYVTYAKVGPDGRDQAGAGLGFVDIFNTDGSFVKRFASKGSLNAPWGVTMAPAAFLAEQDMDKGDNDNGGHGGGNDNSGPGNNNGNNDNSGPGNNNGRNDNNNISQNPVILVGNFGDGHINVYTMDGTFQGQLQTHNRTIVIDGLWALMFEPSTAVPANPNRLYFTAGPDRETNGLFGYLTKQP
jgi:uncharacterized protein (TIGR03118 family)